MKEKRNDGMRGKRSSAGERRLKNSITSPGGFAYRDIRFFRAFSCKSTLRMVS